MSVTYQFDWRKSLAEFVEDIGKLGIEEIQRIEPTTNKIQLGW